MGLFRISTWVGVSKKELLSFVACLASGRACLTFDNEGAARLTLELSQPEAAKVAERLPELVDVTFAVVCKPLGH